MKCKSIFDWIKHINQYKTAADQFSAADWDIFNSYMIHRFVSMNPSHIAIVNEAQHLQPTDKRQIYEFYRDFIPKNNRFSKYIKSKSKTYNTELLTELADHYLVSQREVKDYITLLDKQPIVRILEQRGFENKYIKKLLK